VPGIELLTFGAAAFDLLSSAQSYSSLVVFALPESE
jgi:hypothetical protein